MKAEKTKLAEAQEEIERELLINEDDLETIKRSPDGQSPKTLEWRGIRTEPKQLELFEVVR